MTTEPFKSTINLHITALSQWIDDSPSYDGLDAELHIRRRTNKIAEEYGEVVEALGGVVGENPRTGVTHTWADVDYELLDVATSALGALVSRHGNNLDIVRELAVHVEYVAGRAGLRVNTYPCGCGEFGPARNRVTIHLPSCATHGRKATDQ